MERERGRGGEGEREREREREREKTKREKRNVEISTLMAGGKWSFRTTIKTARASSIINPHDGSQESRHKRLLSAQSAILLKGCFIW
jgi:hypothetical protein